MFFMSKLALVKNVADAKLRGAAQTVFSSKVSMKFHTVQSRLGGNLFFKPAVKNTKGHHFVTFLNFKVAPISVLFAVGTSYSGI